MKTLAINMRFLWYCAILSMALFSCAGESKRSSPEEMSLVQRNSYPQVTINSVTLLFPDIGEKSPQMELSLSLLDPGENTLLQDLLYGGLSPMEYADGLIQDYKDFYLELTAQGEVPELPSAVLDWTYEETHDFHTYSRLQVIDRLKEYYTGGAHGMQEKDYFVLDLNEKKQFHLADLFLEGTKGVLKTHIEDALRVYSELKPGAPLSSGYYFEDSVEPSENFFLNPQGIGFHWDPYEIAPYVVGPVEVIIPYGDMEDLFSPRGKLLISQFN
jgi:hypothetical protein